MIPLALALSALTIAATAWADVKTVADVVALVEGMIPARIAGLT